MTPTLVFFDGACGFCDRTVSALFALDRRRRLRFAPLQGEAAKHLLPEHLRSGAFETLILVKDGRIYERSDAVLRIAGAMGFPFSPALVFLVIPRFLRDAAYRLVARNRYRIFGKKDACRLPSAEERAYFFD